MRWLHPLMIVGIILISVSIGNTQDDSFFLKKITVEGNSITRDKFLLSLITLNEGEYYSIDRIIDELNFSRVNLEKTNLFSNIFFNDEIDDEGYLTITVQVRENNYFLFGPSGYIYYEEDIFFSDLSVYVSYTNLFGNGSRITIEVPFYENQGFYLTYNGKSKKLKYTSTFEYLDHYNQELDTIAFISGAAIGFKNNFFGGLNVRFNEDSFSSLIFMPFLEAGEVDRHSLRIKKWYYATLTPFYGYNFNSSSLYGVFTEFHTYWDLLLKIVYALKFEFAIQGGEVPENFLLRSTVRGTNFPDFSGEKRISLTNEFNVPFPWNNNFVIVPFLDINFLGFETFEFLIGGGIGLHWFNKFQDPLVVEFAIGKGLMLNLQKKI
jgi:outer membrane protein assembly factor BamA